MADVFDARVVSFDQMFLKMNLMNSVHQYEQNEVSHDSIYPI